MKNYKRSFTMAGLFIPLLFAAACKKDTLEITTTSAINVINAAVDAGTVKVNPGGGNAFYYKATTDQVTYGTARFYTALSGVRTVTIVSSADTTKTFFSGNLDLQQPVNTLYLAGQSPAVDTLFRAEENIPYINTGVFVPDSAMHVRFVNLSPNSIPVNIKLSNVSEVNSLAYKGISGFKKYAAKWNTGNYVFEIRDASTDALLTSYTLDPVNNRFKTIALVLKGLSGTTTGTNALSVSQINYFN